MKPTNRQFATGYALVLVASTFWGVAALAGKALSDRGIADALLLSQVRATASWVVLLVALLLFAPRQLRVASRDLPWFAVLGIFGIAGANFFLYYAIERMDAAVADVIQFTAPVLIAVYMWSRGREPMDGPKVAALLLSFAGVSLALGLAGGAKQMSTVGVASAALSAIAYATAVILGKSLSGRYAPMTYLHYGLLAATIFWFVLMGPGRLAAAMSVSVAQTVLIAAWGIGSALVPYGLFYMALRWVPASRAAIVSTWEPVVIAIGAWAWLGQSLTASQVAGIGLVIGAILIIELYPKPRPKG